MFYFCSRNSVGKSYRSSIGPIDHRQVIGFATQVVHYERKTISLSPKLPSGESFEKLILNGGNRRWRCIGGFPTFASVGA
ncbi:hypothetical protein V6N13_106032 [Hibiscus sabdariffa]